MIGKARVGRVGVAVVCLGVVLVVVQGCSVVMAARQPGKKDLSVLEKGTPRSIVRAELGAPIDFDEPDETHGCHETFAFKQGYGGATKASRAIFHLAADVFTLGLWEIVGTPTEAYFDGTNVRLEVLYDESERVEAVCVYSGGKKVASDVLVSPTEMRHMTTEGAPAPKPEDKIMPDVEQEGTSTDEVDSGGAPVE
jgi:hypothetical protein